MTKQMRSVRLKKVVLEYAALGGSDVKSYRDFEVPRSTFYRWKKAYAREGEAGLIRKKPIARSHPRLISPEATEKILHLRHVYHFGPQRIAWYLERYHGVTTSCSSVYHTLVRQGMSRLPRNVGRRGESNPHPNSPDS